jgi:hypothetical protein
MGYVRPITGNSFVPGPERRGVSTRAMELQFKVSYDLSYCFAFHDLALPLAPPGNKSFIAFSNLSDSKSQTWRCRRSMSKRQIVVVARHQNSRNPRQHDITVQMNKAQCCRCRVVGTCPIYAGQQIICRSGSSGLHWLCNTFTVSKSHCFVLSD